MLLKKKIDFQFQVCLEICNHLEIELFRIPYPPKPVQSSSAGSQKTSTSLNNSSNPIGLHHLSHDRNGAKGNRFVNQAEQDDQIQLTKRQTRSSKRHVVSH